MLNKRQFGSAQFQVNVETEVASYFNILLYLNLLLMRGWVGNQTFDKCHSRLILFGTEEQSIYD